MTVSTEDKLQLAAVLATEESPYAHRPHVIARDASTLLKIARQVQTIAERQCNGVARYDAKIGRASWQWTEDDEKQAEKQLLSAHKKVTLIAEQYGAIVCRCGGDPRGYTLALKLKSGRTNSFGNEHWGIPS